MTISDGLSGQTGNLSDPHHQQDHSHLHEQVSSHHPEIPLSSCDEVYPLVQPIPQPTFINYSYTLLPTQQSYFIPFPPSQVMGTGEISSPEVLYDYGMKLLAEYLTCPSLLKSNLDQAISTFKQALANAEGRLRNSILLQLGKSIILRAKEYDQDSSIESSQTSQSIMKQVSNKLAKDGVTYLLECRCDSLEDRKSKLENIYEAYCRLKDYQRAFEVTSDLLGLAPEKVEYLKMKYTQLYFLGRYEEAYNVGRNILEKDPDILEIYDGLLIISQTLASRKKVNEVLELALERYEFFVLRGKDSTVENLRGALKLLSILEKHGCIQSCPNIASRFCFVYNVIGNVSKNHEYFIKYINANEALKPEEGKVCDSSVIEQTMNYLRSLLDESRKAVCKEQIEETLALLNRYQKKLGEEPFDVLNIKAEAYTKIEEYQKAFECYKQAWLLQLRKGHSTLETNKKIYGLLKALHDDYKILFPGAKALAIEKLRLHTKISKEYLNLKRAVVEKKEPSPPVENSENESSREKLLQEARTLFYSNNPNYETIIDLLNRTASFSEIAIYMLSYSQVELGRFEEAEKALNMGLGAFPNSTDLHYIDVMLQVVRYEKLQTEDLAKTAIRKCRSYTTEIIGRLNLKFEKEDDTVTCPTPILSSFQLANIFAQEDPQYKSYVEILRKNPWEIKKYSNSLYTESRLLRKLKTEDSSKRVEYNLRACILMNPTDEAFYKVLISYYQEIEAYKKAVECCKEAIVKLPSIDFFKTHLQSLEEQLPKKDLPLPPAAETKVLPTIPPPPTSPNLLEAYKACSDSQKQFIYDFLGCLMDITENFFLKIQSNAISPKDLSDIRENFIKYRRQFTLPVHIPSVNSSLKEMATAYGKIDGEYKPLANAVLTYYFSKVFKLVIDPQISEVTVFDNFDKETHEFVKIVRSSLNRLSESHSKYKDQKAPRYLIDAFFGISLLSLRGNKKNLSKLLDRDTNKPAEKHIAFYLTTRSNNFHLTPFYVNESSEGIITQVSTVARSAEKIQASKQITEHLPKECYEIVAGNISINPQNASKLQGLISESFDTLIIGKFGDIPKNVLEDLTDQTQLYHPTGITKNTVRQVFETLAIHPSPTTVIWPAIEPPRERKRERSVSDTVVENICKKQKVPEKTPVQATDLGSVEDDVEEYVENIELSFPTPSFRMVRIPAQRKARSRRRWQGDLRGSTRSKVEIVHDSPVWNFSDPRYFANLSGPDDPQWELQLQFQKTQSLKYFIERQQFLYKSNPEIFRQLQEQVRIEEKKMMELYRSGHKK